MKPTKKNFFQMNYHTPNVLSKIDIQLLKLQSQVTKTTPYHNPNSNIINNDLNNLKYNSIYHKTEQTFNHSLKTNMIGRISDISVGCNTCGHH